MEYVNNDTLNVGVEIQLKSPEDFLLVKETLTRIGLASNRTKTLFQSAHILHKQGKYYIMHFKEMFLLDGKPSNISAEDINRRNIIVSLLKDWGLVTIVNEQPAFTTGPMSSVRILSYKDKNDWELVAKYTIGNKKGNTHE